MDRPGDDDFATVFARGLERRRMSLSALRDRLASRGYQISLATLSYWRSGHRLPARQESLDALPEIEALLDVPDGTLQALVKDRRRTTRHHPPMPFDRLALGTVDGDLRGEKDVTRILFHLVVDVDRAHERVVSNVTQLFVAARDGVDGVSMFVGPDADGQASGSVRAVSGCRVGEIEESAHGIRSVRLEFERPCRLDETVLVQAEIFDEGPHVAHETEYGVVAEQRLEECLVLVRFAPDDVPSRCWLAFAEGEVDDEWEIDLDGRSTVHHRQTAFGPGTCRVRWEW